MVGAIVVLAVFLVGHLGGAIWVASKMHEQVKQVVRSLGLLSSDVRVLLAQDSRVAVLDSRVRGLEESVRELRRGGGDGQGVRNG